MESAFVGIDVAFAKRKRLPVVVARWRNGRLIPEPLRGLDALPPRGHGNAATIDDDTVASFAEETAAYLQRVAAALHVRIDRIAIDAPSAPCRAGRPRRAAEVAMDQENISCFATPTEAKWIDIRRKVHDHLARGGAHNRIPHANQLWMLVGFCLFDRLSEVAPCLEVFPQATVRALGVGAIHKFKVEGVAAQLGAAARHTGWPTVGGPGPPFEQIAFGPAHDRLDAYLSAWVAALELEERSAFGEPPDDVIWAPRLRAGAFRPLPTIRRLPRKVSQRNEDHSRACPACHAFSFKRWPWGWDAHAAYRCAGLSGKDPHVRKGEFKSRFGHLFGC